MSFSARLIHDLTLYVPRHGIGDDEYGHPEVGVPEQTAIRGLVQPKTVREIALTSQAGPEIGNHTIFLQPMEIPRGAWFVDAENRRYDVKGVRRFEFGRTPHLEVDAEHVTSEDEEGS
jgi:hypothetical protein